MKLPPTSVEDTIFPVGPTGSVPIRIVRPEGVAGPLPVVMYFHGGGWMLGDKQTHDRLIRELARVRERRLSSSTTTVRRKPSIRSPTSRRTPPQSMLRSKAAIWG